MSTIVVSSLDTFSGYFFSENSSSNMLLRYVVLGLLWSMIPLDEVISDTELFTGAVISDERQLRCGLIINIDKFSAVCVDSAK